MTGKTLNTRHALEACTYHLHSWNPFHRSSISAAGKKPPAPAAVDGGSIPGLDLSKLSLIDDDRPPKLKRDHFRWVSRKRRRRASRSLSGRSSEKSGSRRCCSLGPSAAYATCSDFPVAAGTDSSGELFVSGGGDVNWASDVGEARRPEAVEKENPASNGVLHSGVVEGLGNESGYGSEPGYRGDGELGYGDELDEEDDDGRALFWGEDFGGMMEEIPLIFMLLIILILQICL